MQSKTSQTIRDEIKRQMIILLGKEKYKEQKKLFNQQNECEQWESVSETGYKKSKRRDEKMRNGTLKEFGVQQINTLVDNVLENEAIKNSSAGYAIKIGQDMFNAGMISDDKRRYEALKDVSQKSVASWQFRGKVNDVLTDNINKLISTEEFKIKPASKKIQQEAYGSYEETSQKPDKGIQRQYFIEGLQQDPDYVKKLHQKLRMIYEDPKTPKEVKQKVYNISRELINFEKNIKEQEKEVGTQDVILYAEKQKPVVDVQDTGENTQDLRMDTTVVSFSEIVSDQIYKKFVESLITLAQLNGSQKQYAEHVCLTIEGLFQNCEPQKHISHDDLETEHLIKESIQISAPKANIQFSLLNFKNQKLTLDDIVASVKKLIEEISGMSGEIDLSLSVKKQKQILKDKQKIPKVEQENTETIFKLTNNSSHRKKLVE